MKVIVPCGGRSSRYPGVPPKWTLPSADGQPMVMKAVSGLEFDPHDLIITILKEHDEKYDAVVGLRKLFGKSVEIVVLEHQTPSQPATVAETLKKTGLNEPFLVKDSDNGFTLQDLDQPYNYVSTASLNDFDQINPRNKSYVQVDEAGVIASIREKEVISDLFSVGGYFFRSPAEYLSTYEKLIDGAPAWQREIYTSDIIANLILDGTPFRKRDVGNYADWGTINEWRRSLQAQSTYVILLDGFVFERGSRYFSPLFEDTAANPAAVATVKKLITAGNKIVFLSIRPEQAREMTERKLRELDIPACDIIFEAPLGRYGMIASPHPTIPFSMAHARELEPGDPNLDTKITFEN